MSSLLRAKQIQGTAISKFVTTDSNKVFTTTYDFTASSVPFVPGISGMVSTDVNAAIIEAFNAVTSGIPNPVTVNIIMANGFVVKAQNGGGELNLRNGTNSFVFLSTDNSVGTQGFVDLRPTKAQIAFNGNGLNATAANVTITHSTAIVFTAPTVSFTNANIGITSNILTTTATSKTWTLPNATGTIMLGSGASGRLARFNGTNSVTTSVLWDDGVNAGCPGTLSDTFFSINGTTSSAIQACFVVSTQYNLAGGDSSTPVTFRANIFSSPATPIATFTNVFVNPAVNLSGGASNTLTNLFSLKVSGQVNAGTVVNYYGIYIASPSVVGTITNRYALITDANAGSIGLGNPTPLSKLSVNGNFSLGTYAGAGNAAAPANGFIVSGAVGIGTALPLSKLDVNGNLAIGTYAGTVAAPSNGLIVSGNVGIGTSAPLVALDLFSASTSEMFIRSNSGILRMVTSLGVNYIQSGLLPTLDSKADLHFTSIYNGTIWMSIKGATGNVGIGTTLPLSKLDVFGGLAVGTYAGTVASPSNGLIVSGNVGIGTSSPSERLEVNGNIKTAIGGMFAAGSWKLGTLRTAAVVADTTSYIEIEINGIVYKLIKAV